MTVLDQYDYESSVYSPSESSNAASVDHNKIFRASYGRELLYQRLAYESRDLWCQWNEDLQKAFLDPELAVTLPKGLTPDTILFNESGMLRVQPSTVLSSLEKETLANMNSEGLRATQYIRTDSADRQRAEVNGWIHKLLAFPVPSNSSGSLSLEENFTDECFEAVLDSTAGFVLCSKACSFALWKARRAGVQFVLGPTIGKFKELIEKELPDGRKKVTGVRTANDLEHNADIIIIAGRIGFINFFYQLEYFEPFLTKVGLIVTYSYHPYPRILKRHVATLLLFLYPRNKKFYGTNTPLLNFLFLLGKVPVAIKVDEMQEAFMYFLEMKKALSRLATAV